jgi:predicted P-loop ATPase
MLVREPPWEERDFVPRPIRDDDFFMLAAQLEYCGIKVGKDVAADAAVRVAKENSINPPREFLARLEWDGKPRLDSWLAYYLGADAQPPEYLAMVGAKWLIGVVSRVFRPGTKFDSVLILEGEQGLRKSTALRVLATFHGEDFFLDSVGDIRSKDTLMTMQGKLIVEIAELASFRKSENEEIKAFITRQVDEYRPPYGRTVLKRPRYFVLAGSTNELDDGYLTDDTGNRRYWPVKCGGIDVESLERDAMQLWAEAVVRYREGERTWLTKEEAVLSTHEQKQRFLEDAWQERIAEIVKFEPSLKLDDVLTKLELKPRDISNMVKKRVKNSLKQLGWCETRRAGEGRVWRPGDGVQRPVPPKPVGPDDMFSESLIEG